MIHLNNCSIEQNFISDFPLNEDYNKYYNLVINDFKIVKSYFPLVKITALPTVKPKEVFISGNLIPTDVLQKCITTNDIERNSLYILGVYPSGFPKDTLYVEDLYKKIDWSKIPYEHRHQRTYLKTQRSILCTHHPNGEINGINETDKTIAILASAWKLYIQYKKYLNTNKWILNDLKHGSDAKIQLEKLGKYYSNESI